MAQNGNPRFFPPHRRYDPPRGYDLKRLPLYAKAGGQAWAMDFIGKPENERRRIIMRVSPPPCALTLAAPVIQSLLSARLQSNPCLVAVSSLISRSLWCPLRSDWGGTLFNDEAVVRATAWIPGRSATCLREADLNVLSKLGNQGLEWRLEPEAFTRREVRREDDLLDILVGCPIDIQVAWQPST